MATSAGVSDSQHKNGLFWSITALISVAVLATIFAALSGGGRVTSADGALTFMPGVNATFNALSAACLVAGAVAIKTRRVALHRAFMLCALVSSAAFLVGYLGYHFMHGDTLYAGTGTMRSVYLALLASHVLLSIVALPLVLGAFWFALTGQFTRHKRLVKWTLPVWLYVSVTGVTVYFMLRASYGG